MTPRQKIRALVGEPSPEQSAAVLEPTSRTRLAARALGLESYLPSHVSEDQHPPVAARVAGRPAGRLFVLSRCPASCSDGAQLNP